VKFSERQIAEIVGKVMQQMDGQQAASSMAKTQPFNGPQPQEDNSKKPTVQAVSLPANNPVLAAIAKRRSIRGYKPEQITHEQLTSLLKAAQEAPSAHNLQPWHFSIVQNRSVLREINEEISSVVRQDVGDVFYGAPTVIFISINPSEYWAKIDAGIAVQTMALAAYSLGLGSVILAFPDAVFSGSRANYFKKLLMFPENYGYAVAIAVGIPNVNPQEAHSIEPGRVSRVN
jgi:nitroreductase